MSSYRFFYHTDEFDCVSEDYSFWCKLQVRLDKRHQLGQEIADALKSLQGAS